MEKMKVKPDDDGNIAVVYIADFSRIDALIELGLNPTDVPKKALIESFRGYCVVDASYDRVWLKSSLDGLVARGFSLDSKYFVSLVTSRVR